jgi:hypothetical protein
VREREREREVILRDTQLEQERHIMGKIETERERETQSEREIE